MEIWKNIIGYDSLYQISNYGNIKSFRTRGGRELEAIMKPRLSRTGYLRIGLRKNNTLKTYPVHILVWEHFGSEERNGRILQVDHKDDNKLNNHINNLQLLTCRENNIKRCSNRNLPTGVSFHKKAGKYMSQIVINKKKVHLGYFNCPTVAALAYQEALKGV